MKYEEIRSHDRWLDFLVRKLFKNHEDFQQSLIESGFEVGLSTVSNWIKNNSLSRGVLTTPDELSRVAKTLGVSEGTLLRLHGLPGAVDLDIPPEADILIALAHDAQEAGLEYIYRSLASGMVKAYEQVKKEMKDN